MKVLDFSLDSDLEPVDQESATVPAVEICLEEKLLRGTFSFVGEGRGGGCCTSANETPVLVSPIHEVEIT